MAHILDGDGLRTRAGWSCPRCSRCYGPQVDECRHCPDGETGKVPDEGPEPIVYTDKGPVPFSAFACGPVPPNKPVTPAIFVPLRDVGVPIVPGQVRAVQDMLNEAARVTGNLVDGKFVVLPVGAKILPAHPGREWVNVGLMAESGNVRVFVATDEWGDVVPGLQCRLRSIGEQSLSFRLTPADGSR